MSLMAARLFLIDVAQGFGGEVGECGVAVDGHDEVSFREDGAQDVDDAVSAAECEAVGVGAPLPSLIMPRSAQARPPYAGRIGSARQPTTSSRELQPWHQRAEPGHGSLRLAGQPRCR